MQLTLHTDYSLRVLVYLAQKGGQQATISEIADFYQISRNHLVKVVHHLAGEGFIHTTRGKHGGMVLARAAELISVGDVVQRMEPNFHIVECFNNNNPACMIAPVCALKNVLYKAGREFLAVLDNYSLADAVSAEPEAGKEVFPLHWHDIGNTGKG